jgi:hypothetical protein
LLSLLGRVLNAPLVLSDASGRVLEREKSRRINLDDIDPNSVTIRIVILSPVSYGRELVANERRAEMITNAKKYGQKLY